MRIFAVPPKALALCLLLGAAGLAGGLTTGFWIAPLGIAIIGRHDLAALTQMPRVCWVMPVVPPWYSETERNVWNLCAIGAILFAGFVMHWAMQWWRHLVVKKFRWMTDDEVEQFYDRMPEG